MTQGIATTFFVLATGFLLGSVLPAELLARRRNLDIRKVGDGNPGAVNAIKGLGAATGLVALVYDMSVGVVTIQLAWLLRTPEPVAYLGGLMTVLGHRFPAFNGFRNGGQGMAACAGMLLYGLWKVSSRGWLPVSTLLLIVVLGIVVLLLTRSDKMIAIVILPVLVAALMFARIPWDLLAFLTVLAARIWLVQFAILRETCSMRDLLATVTRFRH